MPGGETEKLIAAHRMAKANDGPLHLVLEMVYNTPKVSGVVNPGGDRNLDSFYLL